MSGSGNRRAGLAGGLLALALLGAVAAGSAHATIFDDGNDRKILFDLREKPLLARSDDEHLILRAADRYGNVGFCSKAGGNAILIDYFGRPAIVTSAHMILDRAGKPRCTEAEMRGATYMPNVSYYDERSEHPDTFTLRKVKLVQPAPRMDGRSAFPDDDIIIFYLEEDIAADVMPDGHVRGAMRPASTGSDQATMIGIAPDIRGGRAALHQTCRYKPHTIRAGSIVVSFGIRHDCDTVGGSRGSMLAVRQDAELRLLGIHYWGSEHGDAAVPPSDDHLQWNIASHVPDPGSPNITDKTKRIYIEPFRNPALIPYQLQFLLHRAGCYSGKLDNQWGPGSRKALDAFVSRTGAKLPGREPTLELWDALEAAVKEPKAACG